MKKTIPTKLFYKIGEVASIAGVEPYVLRYWESEFNLKVTKSKNNQRLYQRKDIDLIQKIKALLYDEKYTIAGAKRKLRERRKKGEEDQLSLTLPAGDTQSRQIKDTMGLIRQEVASLLEIVERSGAPK